MTMKNLLRISFSLLIGILAAGSIQAQICTPLDTFTQPGLSPSEDSLPCFVKGDWSESIIQFKNYDSTTAAGLGLVYIDSITIDSITNIPNGLTWDIYPGTTLVKNQVGCIAVAGTVSDSSGEYLLGINFIAYVKFGSPSGSETALPYTASQLGLKYYLRVSLPGDTCFTIDTASNSPLQRTSTTHANDSTNAWTGINHVNNNILGLNNFPNPYTGNTEIVFGSREQKQMTFTVYNVLGQMVHNENFSSVAGKNTIQFDGSKLESGMYFYSISDGINTVTNRMVVSQ